MNQAPALGFIHRFQAGTDPAAPALLLLHGTGGDENDLVPLGRAISPGSALLSVRGKVLENGMPRFFRRLEEGIFDLEDLALRTDELARFLEAAAKHYGFPLDSLVAVGFSNGANIAANLLFRSGQALAGAILIRAMLPYVPEKPSALTGKPVLLLSGKLDPIVPLAQPEHLAAVLRSAGAEVTLRWINAGHTLTQLDISTVSEWLVLARSSLSAKLNYT